MDYRSLLQLAMMVINGCSLIAFLTLVIQSDGACKSSLFKLYKDRYLPNHLIKSICAMSQVECSMMCSGEDECESWNMYEAVPGRNCELNNATVKTESANHVLQRRNGATFGHRITLPRTKNTKAVDPGLKNISYIFTNLGSEGPEGPANASGYLGTTLEGQVTLNAGIQMWQVPYTGTYIIESRGAAGANGTCYTERGGSARTWHRGGLGAKISGKFWLTLGTLLKILVGQRGMIGTHFCYTNAAGGGGGAGAGGGSFVTYVNNTPLIIAGGGGGGGSGCGDGCVVVAGKFDGDPGQLGVLGSRCNSTVGNGGMICSNEKGYTIYAGSGAGLLSNGSNSPTWSWLHPARCFVDGGRGSIAIQDGGDGGFGGGGGFGLRYGGGGGGYTGGGVWGNSTNSIAGGGGSVNHGFDKQSGYGDALEHGLVKIVFLG